MSLQIPEQHRYTGKETNLPEKFWSKPGDQFGMFLIPMRDGVVPDCWALCMLGAGAGWDHVSLTLRKDQSLEPFRVTPTWGMMCLVKDHFWQKSDTVVQFHPAKAAYINVHPFCLHLWRCHAGFPEPDIALV
jgi:hypothetical protein